MSLTRLPSCLALTSPRALLRIVLLAALTLLCGMAASSAWARTVLDLDTQQQPVALKDWGDYWVDSTGKLTASQVSTAGAHHLPPVR